MSAYTRTTGKKILVQRKVFAGSRHTFMCVQAVPVSRVLKPLPCDHCRKEIQCGSFVLRERMWGYYRTTCENCAEFIPVDSLLDTMAA